MRLHPCTQHGHVDVIRALAELGCDFEFFSNSVLSPLMTAVKRDQSESASLLVNMGADVKQCLDASAPPSVTCTHIREMVSELAVRVGSPISCSIFALTNLMS